MKNLKEFYRPQNLKEAVKLLSRKTPATNIIAGGTTVVRLKSPKIEALVDVTQLNLNSIELKGKFLKIGAVVTITELLESEIIKNFAEGILHQAALSIGSTLLRNVITIGGNISAGRIWSDLPPVLLALDARFKITGKRTRIIKAVDFFKKPPSSNFKKDEILTEIIIPKPQETVKSTFVKFSQTSFDYALFNLAVLSSFSKRKCKKIAIAIGAAVNPPQRLNKLEKLLKGKKINEELINKAYSRATKGLKFVKSFRVSQEYLEKIIQVTIGRTLEGLVID